MLKLIIPAVLTRYAPLADKSFNLGFNIAEPTPQAREIIHSMHQQAVFMMLKDSEFSNKENAEFDKLEADLYDNQKTQSQRLRGVLFRNWENHDKGFKDFKDYYKAETEIIIQHYKNKLD